MDFKDFVENGKVKKGERDIQLAKSLLETTEQDLVFLNSLKVSSISARRIFSNYYDCLRAIIESIAALDGFKVYSHEAFTYYLKQNKKEENAALIYDRLRKIRNNINYYGKSITAEESEEHKEKIMELIRVLRRKYLGNLK